jgi:thioredoxin reductase
MVSSCVTLSDGRRLRSRTIVIASGARYRRPQVQRLEEFEGRGVWYWASALEAKMCAQSEVVVVGGGNSAGQAAVFLAQHASNVHMLVRGPDHRWQHVALPDRSHRRDAEYRAAFPDATYGASW